MEFKYRPDVDGLRAVAVGLVVLFHAGFGFDGGYIGVDVFFVISGFLITGLILKEQSTGKFSLSNFWGRRIRRIIPAATTVGLVCLVAGFFLLLPADLADLAESLVAQQTMLANVYFWLNTNYFDGPAETKALLHCWSLAVEEQFYIGFPLLLMMLKGVSRRTLSFIFIAVAVVSFALSEWGVRNYASAAFYLLPTRAWELLIGAILACCPKPTKLGRGPKEVGAWVGMAGILITGWFYNELTPFPGISAAIPCFATFAVIYFNSDELSSLGSLLAIRPLVFVGLISYSWYLWHWPILAFARYWFGLELDSLTAGIAIIASFLIAIASWRFVETPFRKGFASLPTSRLVIGAVASGMVILGMCFLVIANDGFASRFPANVVELAKPIPKPKRYAIDVSEIKNRQLIELGLFNSSDQKPSFLVWGDSHAMALAESLDRFCREQDLRGVMAARGGTIPILDVWRPNDPDQPERVLQWNDEVLRYVIENEIKHVILVSRWAVNLLGRVNGRLDTLLAGRDENVGTFESAEQAFATGLRRTLNELGQAGVRVVIIKQVPLQPQSPQRSIVLSLLLGKDIPQGVSLQEHDERQAMVDAIIDKTILGRARTTVIDPRETCFDANGRSMIGSEAGSFYVDEDHVSNLGAQAFIMPLLDDWLHSIKTEEAQRRD